MDFLAELPNPESSTSGTESPNVGQVFTDGSVGAEGSGVGILLVSFFGEEMWISIRLGFKASYNEVKYKVVMLALQATRAVGVTRVQVHLDSQLVMPQIHLSMSNMTVS